MQNHFAARYRYQNIRVLYILQRKAKAKTLVSPHVASPGLMVLIDAAAIDAAVSAATALPTAGVAATGVAGRVTRGRRGVRNLGAEMVTSHI